MNGAGFRLDAWALPEGVPLPRIEEADDVDGVRVRTLAPDARWVEELAGRLRDAGVALRARSAQDVAGVLGRVASRFLDEGDPLRTEALSLLPATSGLSPEMASAVLDGMACDWSAERLVALLDTEFPDPTALDGFVEGDHGCARAMPPGLCVQVVSGSVPGVSATALLRSLLVKGPTLVKPGRGDLVLPVLLARALQEEDLELGAAMAVLYWPGGAEELEGAALAQADVVAAYGGDEAVRALRDRTPITARFVAYHHRISVGIVGREALTPERAHRTASEVAGATAFFDQRGCVSPQVVFVEDGGELPPGDFAHDVAAAMASVEKSLPGGSLDPAEAAALQQVRGTAEVLAAAGTGAEVYHGGDATWTVVFDPAGDLRPSCVGRVVRVVPVRDALEVPSRISAWSTHLQTAGVAGFEGIRLRTLADHLAEVGASRITSFAEVPFPPPWWHHDGGGPLTALVRWVDLEA